MKENFTVIFDLDGTLIDSKDSIISSIQKALEETGIKSIIPMADVVIAPPLIETLSLITGSHDVSLIARLAEKFQDIYDFDGCKNSIKYPDSDWTLGVLREAGIELCLVTNKRSIPTLNILNHLNWSSSFKHIYAIDSLGYNFKNKAETISTFLKISKINSSRALYVGDRYEDFEAAKANDMQAILVAWGYGKNLYSLSEPALVKTFSELVSEIRKLQ
jgi:phosphoglycolate phosphatase